MRILSQDGTIDVPYEQVSIERKGTNIWCGYKATLGRSYVGKLSADYSSEEKAEKAMEMLHEKYTEFESSKVAYNALIGLCAIKNADEKAVVSGLKQITGSIIFQFPQDSEIEV